PGELDRTTEHRSTGGPTRESRTAAALPTPQRTAPAALPEAASTSTTDASAPAAHSITVDRDDQPPGRALWCSPQLSRSATGSGTSAPGPVHSNSTRQHLRR